MSHSNFFLRLFSFPSPPLFFSPLQSIGSDAATTQILFKVNANICIVTPYSNSSEQVSFSLLSSSCNLFDAFDLFSRRALTSLFIPSLRLQPFFRWAYGVHPSTINYPSHPNLFGEPSPSSSGRGFGLDWSIILGGALLGGMWVAYS